MQQEVIEGGRGREGLASSICPKCLGVFMPKRKDQRYCKKTCAKAASRHTARGPRERENRTRNEAHYSCAAWLSYDLNRMPPAKRRAMILALLEAASGANGALRGILLDPRLLGAGRDDPIGKLYPDTHSSDAKNIAKTVYAFCQAEWGCSTEDAIKDGCKPAFRKFKEEAATAVSPQSEKSDHCEQETYLKRNPKEFLQAIRELRTLRPTKPLPSIVELDARFLKLYGMPRPDLQQEIAVFNASMNV